LGISVGVGGCHSAGCEPATPYPIAHGSATLAVSPNVTLRPLPPRCPQRSPVENIWQFMRANSLSNRIGKSSNDIVDHCCCDWSERVEQLQGIISRGLRNQAHEFCSTPFGLTHMQVMPCRRACPSSVPMSRKVTDRAAAQLAWCASRQSQMQMVVMSFMELHEPFPYQLRIVEQDCCPRVPRTHHLDKLPGCGPIILST
jgi:hypothetical protein